MLTRQGWMVVWAALAVLGAAYVVGITELYLFGAVGLALVLGAVAYVRLVRLDLHVNRQAHPARAHAGSTCRVEIHLRNLRNTTTPPLRIHEEVSGTTGADLLLPPVGVGGQATTNYRLPTARRGVLKVGPLNVSVTDPFGLAQSSVPAAEQVSVTIFPRVDQIQPVPFTVGHDPLGGTAQANALSHSGDDFYALRPYVMGDDLRRIHWPSTARHDELLVCQHEQPWQGRTTVLVDVDRNSYTAEGLEAAISAAASVATANMQRNDLVRLITSDGRDSGFGMGRAHLEGILEHLALVQATSRADLTSAAAVLQQDKGSGGALVVISGELASPKAQAVAHLGRRVGLLLHIQVARDGAGDNNSADGRAGPLGSRSGPRGHGAAATLQLTPHTPLPTVWNAMLRARQGALGPAPTAGRSR